MFTEKTVNPIWSGKEFKDTMKKTNPDFKFYILEHPGDSKDNYHEAYQQINKEALQKIKEFGEEQSKKMIPLIEKVNELNDKINARYETFKMTKEEAEEYFKEYLKEQEEWKADPKNKNRFLLPTFDSVEEVLENIHDRLRSDLSEEDKIQHTKDIDEVNRLHKEICDIHNSHFPGKFDTKIVQERSRRIGLEKNRNISKLEASKKFKSGGGQLFITQFILSDWFWEINEYSFQISQIFIPDDAQVRVSERGCGRFICDKFEIIDDDIALEDHVSQEILYDELEMKPKLFKFVKDRSDQRCMDCILINPSVLEFIDNQTPKMLIHALDSKCDYFIKNPWRFSKISTKDFENIDELEIKLIKNFKEGIESVREQTPELVKLHIETHNSAWGIKKDKFTYDNAMLAAKLCSSASILLADVECVDEAIILEYIKGESDLKFVKREKQTFNIVMKSVSQFGKSRQYVSNKSYGIGGSKYERFTFPPEQQKMIDLASVKQDGEALEFIEEDLQDFEIIYQALQQNIKARKFIKAKLSKEEKEKIYLLCLDTDINIFNEIPEEDQTYEMILKVASKNPSLNKNIKMKLDPEKQKQVDLVAVEKSWRALIDIPKERQSFDLIIKSLQNADKESLNPEYCEIVKDRLFYNAIKIELTPKQWEEVDLKIVGINPELLQHIPKERQTWDIVDSAINKDPKVRKYVKAELSIDQFEKINNFCVSADGMILEYIPFDQQDIKLIMIAMKQNKLCSKFIDPDEIVYLLDIGVNSRMF